MRTLIIVLFILLNFNSLFSGEYPLPEGIKFVFPKRLSIKAEWLVPAKASPVKTKNKINFDLDSKGEPWLSLEGKYLYNPLKRTIFQVDTGFEDFIFLSEREFIIATKDSLGFLTYAQGSPNFTFFPVLSLPKGEVRLSSGDEKRLFVLIFNPERGLSQVFLLQDLGAKGEALKVFETKERVQDLCVAKDNLYLAMNNIIIKVFLSTKRMELFFRHANPLREIECLEEDKILYATSNRLGFVGKRNKVEFAQVLNPKIRLKDQDLYILLEDNLGVIRIKEVGKLDTNF